MLLTADQIFDGHKWLPAGTVIEADAAGNIIALHEPGNPDAVFYDGILTPGFVNCHCHLELSHLKGLIPEHTGLVGFLQQVMKLRKQYEEPEQRFVPRQEGFAEMYANGIVAVGDIANTTDTMDLRSYGKVHFHTFVESLGFSETPQKQFEHSVSVFDAYANQASSKKRLNQTIVPHAPYTVSHVLFKLIDAHNKHGLISIHNQETQAEDEYYLLKKGGMQTLLHGVGINDDFFTPSGKSSLETYLGWMSLSHPFLFVHNTFTKQNDVQIAQSLLKNVFWCLCPNANLYIEDTLPDIGMFIQEDANICIGTDSLSSNHELSVLSELVTIKKHYRHLTWETLFKWGTYNGAVALEMSDIIGSIEPGKQPGILQIQGLDTNIKPIVNRII